MRVHRIVVVMLLVLTVTTPARAWNATGHKVAAGIAWDNMTPQARQSAILLLRAAPPDACLVELFPEDGRPLAERQRDFFIAASIWPDIVRPDDDDPRPCTRFHERDWHFINFFWEGVSGGSGDASPRDLEDFEVADINAVERLVIFRPIVACGTPACGTPIEDRATKLAWILHLVGDIHQPLHTSGRVTTREPEGDQGGNLFKLGRGKNAPSLHGFWDGILNRSVPRQPSEDDAEYVERLISMIKTDHPRANFTNTIDPGDFESWALGGFDLAKSVAYPQSLRRREPPNDDYRRAAFAESKEAIAAAGYRLADLLNRMFP